MKYTYKEKEYNFPTSLAGITLRQRIEFDQLYGKRIRELQEQTFLKDADGEDLPLDELDILYFNTTIATFTFSFYSGISLEEVEQNISMDDVFNIYFSCFSLINQQESEIELQEEYLWNNEFWRIEAPELSFESKITFNELITSKQIVKQMHELGAGNWESILYLAAIYLKREDEVFQENWLKPGSERIEMMYDLPMDIAVAVGFFLQNSMSMYLKTFQSSEVVETEKDLT